MTAARLPATPPVSGSNVPAKPMTVDLADSDRDDARVSITNGCKPAMPSWPTADPKP